MQAKAVLSRIILSPVPLAQDLRQAHGGGTAVFMDLASLRRNGLAGTLRTLRSCRASSVFVTGEEVDLAVFRDVLSLMAFAIPAAERWYAPRGRDPLPLGRSRAPLAAGRIGLGIAAGCEALFANVIRLESMAAGRSMPHIACRQLRRCLYLKPALNFGALVGGAVGHVAGVANALLRSGIEMRMLAVSRQPMIDPAIRQILVPPHSLAAYPHELNLFRYHRKYMREVQRQAEDFKPDFVYQRYSLDDMSGILLRTRKGIPLILEFNGSETWIQRHWGNPLRFQSISERIEEANLHNADLVVVVSEEIKKHVMARGVPEKRVLFYPNCVDTSTFDPERFDGSTLIRVRQDLGVPDDADLFTFVGTFGQWHGTELLASAIRGLVESDSGFLEAHGIHFLLVGDGQYGEKVRSILKGIRCVSLPGYRPQGETPAILAASNVCLSPHVPNPDGTPFFGSPTKLFEYMAMAKPILASDLDQIGWVLRGWHPGETAPTNRERSNAAAILIEPGSQEALIEGIRAAALMPPDIRRRLGERARKLIIESFTWDRNVHTVIDRFQDGMQARLQNRSQLPS